MDDDVRENPSAGVLILPKEIKFDAKTELEFETALIKAMTESMTSVPLIVHGDTVAMGCITWQQHLGRPRWQVSE